MLVPMALQAQESGTQSGTRPVPPLVQQINNGNWLPPEEAQSLRNELYYQQVIQAYMPMLPALNVTGMRDGSEGLFGGGYSILPIWKDRIDSRTGCRRPMPTSFIR